MYSTCSPRIALLHIRARVGQTPNAINLLSSEVSYRLIAVCEFAVRGYNQINHYKTLNGEQRSCATMNAALTRTLTEAARGLAEILPFIRQPIMLSKRIGCLR